MQAKFHQKQKKIQKIGKNLTQIFFLYYSQSDSSLKNCQISPFLAQNILKINLPKYCLEVVMERISDLTPTIFELFVSNIL